jgi:hypothetical protein
MTNRWRAALRLMLTFGVVGLVWLGFVVTGNVPDNFRQPSPHVLAIAIGGFYVTAFAFVYRTPCVKCGKPLGMRAFGRIWREWKCPHCGVGCDEEVAQ